MKILLVFCVTVVLDILWAEYIYHVGKSNPWKSSTYAMVLYILGAFVIMNYVDDKTLLIPAALGSFVGTFLSVRRKQKTSPCSSTG